MLTARKVGAAVAPSRSGAPPGAPGHSGAVTIAKTARKQSESAPRRHRGPQPARPKRRAKAEPARPRTRGDCDHIGRPCPFVGCRYHLYLEVRDGSGSIKLNFPDKEVWELDETCALDAAEADGMTLSEIGRRLNLTRERIRQIERKALRKLGALGIDLDEFLED